MYLTEAIPLKLTPLALNTPPVLISFPEDLRKSLGFCNKLVTMQIQFCLPPPLQEVTAHVY